MISDQDRYVYCAICGEPSTLLLPGPDGRKWGACDDHAPGSREGRQAEMNAPCRDSRYVIVMDPATNEDEEAQRRFEDRADDEAHQLPEYRI